MPFDARDGKRERLAIGSLAKHASAYPADAGSRLGHTRPQVFSKPGNVRGREEKEKTEKTEKKRKEKDERSSARHNEETNGEARLKPRRIPPNRDAAYARARSRFRPRDRKERAFEYE